MTLVALGCRAQAVAPDNEGMTLNAQEWTRDVVMGWNLGNSLECPKTETEWGNPKTTQAMIKAVADKGFNAIRIPVRWINHVNNTTEMAVNPEWLARVKEVVDWALAENMYVIINSHHEDWYDRNPYYSKQEENNRKLGALWTSIATYFRDYGEKLIFAGTNEITVNWSAPSTEQQKVQNSYNQTFVDAVRNTGGKNYYRNLVVQTFACSPYHGLNGFTIPNDKVEGRLSVEFHYYDPYDYCGNCTYYYWGEAYKDKGSIITNSTESTITNLFDRIFNTWMKQGLGVVMGEKCVVGEARKHGFAAFAWDNNQFNNGSENFGIFKRWQNMEVGNIYFLNGITEGSATEYEEPQGHEGEEEVEGATFWEGNSILDWGNGLQLTIPGSQFEGKGNNVRLSLSYTQEYNDYDNIQLFFGDWSAQVKFTVGNQSFTGDFIPSNYYFTGSGTSHVTAMAFTEATLNTILQRGVVIQGHGIRLKKVTIGTPTGINAVTIDDTMTDAPIYTIEGKRVERTLPGHLYVKKGKKFIAR